MSDTNPKHTQEWMPTDADMRGGFQAAKRIHVEHGHDADWSWWVGYGKSEDCQIEGTPSHWFWLAYMMLGLADEADAPYSEDKPLPFSPEYVRQCVNEHAALKARCEEFEKALAWIANSEDESTGHVKCIDLARALLSPRDGEAP